jgi:hypothetical protein
MHCSDKYNKYTYFALTKTKYITLLEKCEKTLFSSWLAEEGAPEKC